MLFKKFRIRLKQNKFLERKEWFNVDDVILASIKRRFFAVLIDLVIIILLYLIIVLILYWCGIKVLHLQINQFKETEISTSHPDDPINPVLKKFLAVIPSLYYILITYFTNGYTVGKRLLGIRIISIYHHRINLWHCIERTLGYALSALEAGFGFIQALWNPNKMALHDRIAETIVVRRKSIKNKNNS